MTQPDVASLPAAADLPSVMAESLFPAIIESSNDAILSKTLDGVITSWNPAATRIFGYSAEEMLGQSVLCTLVFYGYGLGWFEQLPRAWQVPFVCGVFLLQVLFSRWWLTHFRFGPMEWLWRAATYLRWPALRRTA